MTTMQKTHADAHIAVARFVRMRVRPAMFQSPPEDGAVGFHLHRRYVVITYQPVTCCYAVKYRPQVGVSTAALELSGHCRRRHHHRLMVQGWTLRQPRTPRLL